MLNADTLYAFDSEFRKDYATICGVDEAGRGPLCGPVCVAAVILDENIIIDGLNDSKKLTEKKRAELFPIIKQHAKSYSIVMIGPEVIDEINILNATLLGMKNAVENLNITPNLALIDGNKCPDLLLKSQAVVKGDSFSASIAAASVLAKVARDMHMEELSAKYPQYLFEKHKGYPTKQHYEIIEKHGILPFYRKSFLKKRGIV